MTSDGPKPGKLIDIATEAQFDSLVRQKHAVVLIFAEWTPQLESIVSLLEDWVDTSFGDDAPRGTEISRVAPWGFSCAHNWIYDQKPLQFRNSDGNLTCLAAMGTLVWLSSGTVVDVERKILDRSLNDLSSRTRRAFRV
jgi:hypothetical protein